MGGFRVADVRIATTAPSIPAIATGKSRLQYLSVLFLAGLIPIIVFHPWHPDIWATLRIH